MTDSKKEYLEFIIAPYLASTQISYLYSEGAAQAVHGSLDLLLFSKMPVILSYDDTHFEWTTDELVMQKLGLTREKFEELILLWTYPLETLDRTKDLLQVSEIALSKAKARPGISKLKAVYKYPVIFDSDCVCRTLDKGQKMPRETEEFMGIKLPPKCYLYLLLGLVSGKLLSIIVSGKILDYANVVKNDMLRGFNVNNKAGKYQILLNLLRSSGIMKVYLEKIMKLIYIDRMNNSGIDAPMAGDVPKDPLYWDIGYAKITEEMDRQLIKEGQIGPLFCIKWYVSEVSKALEVRNLKKIEKPKEMKKARELLCHTIFMYLEHRNFLAGDKGVLILGNLYQMIPYEYQNEAMVFFELLAYAGFSGMGEKSATEKKDLISKQLISEIFSLVPMKLKKGSAEDWNEYIVTKEFANFIAVARSAWSACREFVEGLLFTLFCSTDDSKALDVEEFEKTFELLPFCEKPNYLLGNLMIHLLDEAEKQDGKQEEHPLAGPSKKFVLAEDIVGDIKRGYMFWNCTLNIVSGIYAHKAIDQERYERFVEANKYLEAKLEVLGIKDMIKSK